ncbi:hypothetical protein CEXT_245891 [Caerostris extrusa]|uniref:Uncharacterized protein n=1 Tax=Caerostris extrusa TaxID=172846 RepID=A0AAV4MCW0_CAEEX|nr:hypothetical protein CEXT_245891 [Caerostris extrusa]
MPRFGTYAITVRDSNPLMGSTTVAVFRNVEILHVCYYRPRFESPCGLDCRRCHQKFELCTYATTIDDSNPLMGYFAVAVFRHEEIMHLSNYYLKFESTCGFYLRFESNYGLYCCHCCQT